MRTIALRYSELFSPSAGAIVAHQAVIDERGSVWYGKSGKPIGQSAADAVLQNSDPRILLTQKGGPERWWAFVDAIQRDRPDEALIPKYYKDMGTRPECWLHITRFAKAPDDIMSLCIVPSVHKPLALAACQSQSPYFIIDCPDSLCSLEGID